MANVYAVSSLESPFFPFFDFIFFAIMFLNELLSMFSFGMAVVLIMFFRALWNSGGEDHDSVGVVRMIYALVGALAMLGILVGIGINQPRRSTMLLWCFFYLVIALVFDGLVVAALLLQNTVLVELLLGSSAGAATGLGIHVTHHVLEERKAGKAQNHKGRIISL
jgi:hypothetical protein